MSFLEVVDRSSHTQNKKCFINTNFLRVYSFFTSRAYTTPHTKKTTKRRMSPCPQFVAAAVSIEAALVIPLFLFFMVALLMLVNIFGTYSKALADVQQRSRTIALSSFNGENSSDLVSIEKKLTLTPMVKNFGVMDRSIYVGMKYRKWTGYSISGHSVSEKEDEYVYVTRFGTVYHKRRDCKHLNVKMHVATIDEINTIRNMSGEKYSACGTCNGSGTGIVFVTDGGNKYHASASCSGLKRNVTVVKISEVQGMAPCSICGNR